MNERLSALLELKDKRILFVGIGNLLRGDDGIGVYICNEIKDRENIHTLAVESSIENYVGKINSLNPDVLILVDSVSFNREGGYFNLLPISEIKDLTVNTHNISLKRISEFFNMEVLVLGIQPESISVGEGFTGKVKKSADSLIGLINNS